MEAEIKRVHPATIIFTQFLLNFKNEMPSTRRIQLHQYQSNKAGAVEGPYEDIPVRKKEQSSTPDSHFLSIKNQFAG
jgi:hypothetical protein